LPFLDAGHAEPEARAGPILRGGCLPPRRSLWRARAEIARRLRAARSLRVASDFDGTLAPIVEHPRSAGLGRRARDVLRGLARAPGARLAVLSGRALGDLRRRLGIARVFLAGAGGLETLDARGRRTLHAGRPVPAGLRAALEACCAAFPGAWLEDKGPALALHDRALADPASTGARARRAFAAAVRRAFAPYRRRARLLRGRLVFEVLPGRRGDKASALRRWAALEGGSGLWFYFGDDANDEPALRWVARRGGFAVAVGRVRSAARHRLSDPRDVVRFLAWLEREWSALARIRPAPRPRRRPPPRARR